MLFDLHKASDDLTAIKSDNMGKRSVDSNIAFDRAVCFLETSMEIRPVNTLSAYQPILSYPA